MTEGAAVADHGASGDAASASLLARRTAAERLRGQLATVALVVPGVAWLALFFLVPLVIVFVVSLGTRDATGHLLLERLGLQNYAQVTRPEYLPAFANS